MNKNILLVLAVLYCSTCFAQRGGEKGLSFQDSMAVTELFFSGLKEKAKQNDQQASTYFKQITEIDPKNDAALFELATIYHAQNQEKEAEQMARQIVDLKPKNEWYWVLLGNIYLKTNKLPELDQVFDELIKLSPGKDDYYYNKATTLLKQDKTDEALKVYDILEKKHGLSEELIDARQLVYQKQGKTGAATQELEKVVKSNPANSRNALELSQLHITAGNKDKALQVLQEAKKADPANGPVRIALADLYRSQGKSGEAFTELKAAFENPAVDADAKVKSLSSMLSQLTDDKPNDELTALAGILVQVHPNDAKANGIAGDIFLKQNKVAEARAAYKKALELNGEDYRIWDNLIGIEVSQSDFDAVIKDGEEALSLFPSQAALYLYTGMAYSQKSNYTKAVSYLKNAASLETEDKERQADIYSALGGSYNGLKNYKEADITYEKALQILPDYPFTLNSYAYALSLRGENLEKAESISRKSNSLKPNTASFESTYAWVLFRQKKYKDARTWIEKAIKDDKTDNAEHLERYGDILFHLGDTELAVQQWTKAKSRIKSEKLDKKIIEKKYIE